MKKNLLLVSLLGFFGANLAFADQPSLNRAEIGYTKWDDGYDGFVIRGSVGLNENIYLGASYSDTSSSEDEEIEEQGTSESLALGYQLPISDSVAWFAEAGYLGISNKEKSAISKSSNDLNGYQLSTGIRAMLTDNTELYGVIKHWELDVQTITAIDFGARHYFTENIGVFAEHTRGDFDLEIYNVGLSVKF